MAESPVASGLFTHHHSALPHNLRVGHHYNSSLERRLMHVEKLSKGTACNGQTWDSDQACLLLVSLPMMESCGQKERVKPEHHLQSYPS